MRLTCFLVTLMFSVMFVTAAAARTWHITPDGTGDAPTMQAGIDSAAVGDTVSLGCGTYDECNIVLKNGVVLRSDLGDPNCAVIDGQGIDRVLYAYGLGTGTIIEGLTITGGHETASGDHPAGMGGGLFCESASPTIMNCVFVSNQARTGGAVTCWQSCAPVFTRCEFSQNDAGNGGAVALAWGCAPQFLDCRFRTNTALEGGNRHGGAVWFDVECHPYFNGCSFEQNMAQQDGGAMSVGDYSSVTIIGCTFVGNSAASGGGIYCRAFSSVILERCLLAFNSDGGAFSCYLQAYEPILSCCDLFYNADGDWTGCIADQYGVNGNFSTDPLFCDPDLGDFTLRSDSPCLPGNHPDSADCGLIGAFGEGCSGPTSVEKTSWGGIKELFR